LGALFHGELISVNRRCCICSVGLVLLFAATRAFSQGQITFNNRVNNVVIAPVYGPESTDLRLALHGNTEAGTPQGAQAFYSATLRGSDECD